MASQYVNRIQTNREIQTNDVFKYFTYSIKTISQCVRIVIQNERKDEERVGGKCSLPFTVHCSDANFGKQAI